MYKGSNAEKLHNMCLYDLLCRMQHNLDDLLVVDLNPCVLDLIGVDTDAYCDGAGECEKCIAAFLNKRAAD